MSYSPQLTSCLSWRDIVFIVPFESFIAPIMNEYLTIVFLNFKFVICADFIASLNFILIGIFNCCQF